MKKKVNPNLNLIKSMEKRINKEEYKTFLKSIGNLKFLPEIKEHLAEMGYEEKQIELFYSFMTLSADTRSNSPKAKRRYTQDQITKIKKLAKKNKRKKFDKFGNVVGKITTVRG